jgi:hypothetical protein
LRRPGREAVVAGAIPFTDFFRPGLTWSAARTRSTDPRFDEKSWVFSMTSDPDGFLQSGLELVRARARPDAKPVGAGDVVDCRDALLAPAAELSPALRPLRALLDACRDDPARFHEEVLGRRLWSKQVEVCRAIARSPVTVVPAGRAVGKSFLLAGTVLWWLYTRPMSLVITTGPDHRQVVSVLWKEIRRALRPRVEPGGESNSRLILGHDHLTKGYNSPQRLALRHGTGWGALGFAAQYEEGFSGQHAGDLLVIVDEASGVTPQIWSAIHGLAAARLVVVGNPIRYDCHFRGCTTDFARPTRRVYADPLERHSSSSCNS